jgi:Zn-dependent protease with chaperone function
LAYCVNCGQKADQKLGCCPRCGCDSVMPEIIVKNKLKHYDNNRAANGGLDFAYPKERANLIISVILALILTAFFSAATMLIFIPMLFLIYFNFKNRQYQTRREMIPIDNSNNTILNNLTQLACARLRMPLMPAYIKKEASFNAYTMGFGADGWIVIHSSLLDILSPPELLFVIGHELGHAQKRHTTWLMLSGPFYTQRLPWIAALVTPIFNTWSVKAEHTADRAGLLANRNLDASAAALLKISGKPDEAVGEKLERELENSEQDKQSVIEQVYESAFRTHPYIVNRLRQLHHFWSSTDYASLTVQADGDLCS